MKLLLLSALLAGALAAPEPTYGGSSYGSNEMAAPPPAAPVAESMSSGSGEKAGANIQAQEGKKVIGNVEVMVLSQHYGGDSKSIVYNAPPSGGKVHQVVVGGPAGLVYSPPSIQAAVGDQVEFTFLAKNHTVTQSTFPNPCVKNPAGVDSGFMPNMDGQMSPPPKYIFQVKDTKPAWFYCRQKTGSHCGKGMVFSINPTAEKTLEMFMSTAIQQNGTEGGMAAPPPPPVENSPPPPPPTEIAAGSGQESGNTCQCMCLCGSGSFPNGAGLDMFGGSPGALPAMWSMPSSPYVPPPAEQIAPAAAAPETPPAAPWTPPAAQYTPPAAQGYSPPAQAWSAPPAQGYAAPAASPPQGCWGSSCKQEAPSMKKEEPSMKKESGRIEMGSPPAPALEAASNPQNIPSENIATGG